MHMHIGTSWDMKNKISEDKLERKGKQRLLIKPLNSPESLCNHPRFGVSPCTS